MDVEGHQVGNRGPKRRGSNKELAASKLAPAFRYTPGDGRRYTWNGGPWITVDKIVREAGSPLVLAFRAVDQIKAPEVRTATSLMATVDTWRQGV